MGPACLRVPSPSPGLLLLLAGLSVAHASQNESPLSSPPPPSSGPDGGDLPFEFLYPPPRPRPSPPLAVTPRRRSPSNPVAGPSTSIKQHKPRSRKGDRKAANYDSDHQRRGWPVKYEADDTGAWQIAAAWQLHGKRLEDMAASQPDISSNVDISTSPGGNATPQIYDSLPTGWQPAEARPNYDPRSITALSVILAAVIASTIIACVFWRRRVARRAKMARDIETTAAETGEDSDSESSILEEKKPPKKKKKKHWSRTTAMWRSGIRAARRRRKNKTLQPALDTTSMVAGDDEGERPTLGPTTTTVVSPAPSIHPSIRTRPPSPAPPQEPQTNHPPPDVPPDVPSAPEPPAYRRRRVPVPAPEKSPIVPIIQLVTHETLGDDMGDDSTDDEPVPESEQVLMTAHVATDDKSLLARMNAMASSPDEPEPSGSGGEPWSASVPEWVDEDPAAFEDLDQGTGSSVPWRVQEHDASLIPPPPAPLVMVSASYVLPHPYDLPSAPSAPSAPDTPLMPSAPPLEFAEDEILVPSAPLLDLPSTPSAPSLHVSPSTSPRPSPRTLPASDWIIEADAEVPPSGPSLSLPLYQP